MAAAMLPHLFAIHPNGCFIIDRAKVQEGTFTGKGGRQTEAAPVPDGVVESGVADTAQFGLETKRDLDASGVLAGRGVPFLGEAFVRIVVFELPGAIQGLPDGARPVGTGMFGPRLGKDGEGCEIQKEKTANHRNASV